jgi:hypothetical protein
MYSQSQRTAGKICLAPDVGWQRSEDDDKKSGYMVDEGGTEAAKRLGRWSRAGMWPTRVRADGQGQVHGQRGKKWADGQQESVQTSCIFKD